MKCKAMLGSSAKVYNRGSQEKKIQISNSDM